MENSTNYDLKLYEGSDKFNPLNVDVPNFETIDEVMKENEIASVQVATELANNTVHEITRNNPDAQVFRFVATAKWNLGDSMTVDGTPVTALLPSGKNIPDGAYVIGANVLGVLVGTNCTLYLSEMGGVAEDSEKLGGELPSYYATDSDLNNLNTVVSSLGSLLTPLNSRVDSNVVRSTQTVNRGESYVLTSDAYIYATCSNHSDWCRLTFTDGTGEFEIGGLSFAGSGSGNIRQCVFLKKGMKVTHTLDSSGAAVVIRYL